ncbi:MAG: alpha/beta hydrolase [bacterium]|nr:alpha/beta hydrolase [bacterium]
MQTDLTSFHQGQQVLAAGKPLKEAKAAMIMVHGRGATAASILGLAQDIAHPDFAYLAPQANGNSWYPYPFIQPIANNEPYLSSALRAVGDLAAYVVEQGVPHEKLILLGFSQGACLTLEFAARNSRRYGGVIALSGGLIGEPGTQWNYPGSLAETPVFLGCDPRDFHIPESRIHESAEEMARRGGTVTKRLYPNLGHTVNDDELQFVRALMATLTA